MLKPFSSSNIQLGGFLSKVKDVASKTLPAIAAVCAIGIGLSMGAGTAEASQVSNAVMDAQTLNFLITHAQGFDVTQFNDLATQIHKQLSQMPGDTSLINNSGVTKDGLDMLHNASKGSVHNFNAQELQQSIQQAFKAVQANMDEGIKLGMAR